MQEQRPAASVTSALALLFFASGCSALVYQLVWFHLLRLGIGASAVSLGILLATFMGGMCIGSLGLARWVSRRPHPLAVYAVLEAGIGLCGLLLLFFLPLVVKLYINAGGEGGRDLFWRCLVSALGLLPPTILMGATLPAIARWVQSTPEGISRLGLFYGANIAGAVAGVLLAGFFLLRFFDVATATYMAAALNFAAGAGALLLARKTRYQPLEFSEPSRPPQSNRSARIALAVIALSGFIGLGAEVVWTRMLSLVFGATVYGFAVILAIFLLGLGIGTTAGAALVRRVSQPALWLGGAQALLLFAVAYAWRMIRDVLPSWNPVYIADGWPLFWATLNDLVRAGAAMLPGTVLLGASFPLALAVAARPGSDPGRVAGQMYAANTLGAIGGALAFTFLVIPAWGMTRSHYLLAALAAAAALSISTAIPLLRPAPRVRQFARPALFALIAALGWFSFSAWPEAIDRRLTARSGGSRGKPEAREMLFGKDGVTTSVRVELDPVTQSRVLVVNGKGVASSAPNEMRLQRMLGHLPALFHAEPKSALIVGLGTGTTAGAFVPYPAIERIVICEIEARVHEAAGEFFAFENHHVLSDPRTSVVIDDARHYLATTREKFDVITSDPIHPWVRGAAALYSVEFYELVKARLKPGGVISQWIPFYETDEAAAKSMLATFFEVFPEGAFWHNDSSGRGYDGVMLAMDGPLRVDVADLSAKWEAMPSVAASLAGVSFHKPLDLLKTFSGTGRDLRAWTAGGAINRDAALHLEYLSGAAFNRHERDRIFTGLAVHCAYPEHVLLNAGQLEAELRSHLDRLQAGARKRRQQWQY